MNCTQEEKDAINQAVAINALEQISTLWPENTTADVLTVNGINDGKSRAILLDAALKIARGALSKIKP